MKNVFILILSFSSVSQAASVVLKRNVLTFKNDMSTCDKNDSCSLKEFTLIDEKKKVTLNGSIGNSYSTDVRYVVKTKNVADLRDYALVQFIRGCQYTTDAKGVKSFGISRHYFDSVVKFQHADWSIDSDNHDPVYTSWKGNRFALYRWNKNPASYDPETATYLAKNDPPHSVVFSTDLPGSFSRSGLTASNSSLEFEMCLFKIKDLPLATTPEGAGINKEDAIKCHAWESKFTFDPKKNDYVMGGRLEPFCLEH